MDQVRAERLINQHGANALFVVIHKWPNIKEYKEHPELLPSLERLVRKKLVQVVGQPICSTRNRWTKNWSLSVAAVVFVVVVVDVVVRDWAT